ncbi:MAG: AAA family ATPase [Clostridia bacterium]|nr:AAA family ATPase [Clostridia bacterium]
MGIYIRGFSIDWQEIDRDSYLRQIEAIRDLDALQFRKPITFFVGENGSGKSTLLEAIAITYGFNPEGGTRNYHFSTKDTHSELCGAIRLVRNPARARRGYFLRAESFYNVATAEEEYAEVSREYHRKSHGESFLAVVQDNFKGNGIYLLDEPEAALSPQRQLTLMLEMVHCARENAQFIVVTHSPILLGMPDSEILSFDSGTIHPIEYEETESYRITEMFLRNRHGFLKRLLDENDDA